MNLLEAITRVADDCKVSSSNTAIIERITREINRVLSEIWDGYRWSFRWRSYRIVTDTDYTTGTVTLTNGSRTVTGAGTTFLSSHVGWHIYFTGDSYQNVYRIKAYTSATELELDVPYQGTSGSSKAYVLRHLDYVLPTEIWDFGTIETTVDGRPFGLTDPSAHYTISTASLSTGSPVSASIQSSDFTPTTYSTGTVSGTINTNTLTGSGTSWLDNVYPGDLITIGSYTYTVETVLSDTSIRLYNYQQVTSSDVTYEIRRQFGRVIRILYPSNTKLTLEIRALRKYFNLVHNSDTNELLYRYPHPAILKVSALELKGQDDKKAAISYQEAGISLTMAKMEDDGITYKENNAPIHSYRTRR